jgi:hypothetical protein
MIAEGGPQRERPPELYPDHGPRFPLADLETAASQFGDNGVRDDIGHIVLGDDRGHFHAVTVLLTADTISFRPDIDDVDIHADRLFERDLLDAGLRHVIERDPVDCYAHPLRKGQAKLWTG